MRDIMVDIETTSTSPESGAILQIGAVEFDVMSGKTGDTFKVSLSTPGNRYWSEDTRMFWAKRQKLYADITAKSLPPSVGFKKFLDWVNSKSDNARFWSKPLSFDYPFIDSYCKQYGFNNPFNFYEARDVRSFIMGITGLDEIKIPMKAGLTEHDALADALNQTLWVIEFWKNRGKYVGK